MRIDWLGTLKMRERKMQDWNLVTNKYGTTNMALQKCRHRSTNRRRNTKEET